MAPAPWATPEQQEFLKGRRADYQLHQAKKTLHAFWPAVYRDFFLRWPIKQVTPNTGEAESDRTGDRDEREITEGLQKKIRTWFNNHGNEKGRKAGKAAAIVLGKPDPTRVHQAHEIYSQLFYNERLKSEVLAEVERTKERHVVVAARVARKAFAAESEDVRAMVFAKLEEEKQAKEKSAEAAEVEEAATRTALTPEEYADGIARLPELLDDFALQAHNLTGWTFTILAGGPDPVQNGHIRTIGYHYGKDPIGNTFGVAYPKFREEILVPYSAFLHSVFSQEERAKRVIIKRTSPEPEAPPLGDDHPEPNAADNDSDTGDSTDQIGLPDNTHEEDRGASSIEHNAEATAESTWLSAGENRVEDVIAGEGNRGASSVEDVDVDDPANRETNNENPRRLGEGPILEGVRPSDGADETETETANGHEPFPDSVIDPTLLADEVGSSRAVAAPRATNHKKPSAPVEDTTVQRPSELTDEVSGPRKRKRPANKEVVPLTQDRESLPVWLENSRNYLMSGDGDPAWVACIEIWLQLEKDIGYYNVSSVRLSEAKLRPAELSHWLQSRKFNVPDLDALSTFASQWITWWNALQPKWRQATQSGSLPLSIGQHESRLLTSLRKGGPNGIVTVLIGLKWWRAAEDRNWMAAVKDVSACLERCLEGQKGQRGQRGTGAREKKQRGE